MGALNAAFVASRPQSAATARQLDRIWCDLQRDDIFPLRTSALIGGVCGWRDQLVPDRGLRRRIGRHVEFDDLADAAIPLHLVTLDLTEGCELLLSNGPAVDAVAASASIAGVFPPVEMAEGLLVDGGVVNNTPISHAVELGAEKVYVLPTRTRAANPEASRRALSTPRCTGSASSSTAGSRSTSPATRTRPS